MLTTDGTKAAKYTALALTAASIASTIHWFISWLFAASNIALFVGYGLFFVFAIVCGWFVRAMLSYLF